MSIRPTRIAATGAVQEQHSVAGRTIQVLTVGNGHVVLVDGKAVINDRDDAQVWIKSTHEGGGRVYVLVEESSGGIACPSMYQVVDLSSGGTVASPQFGNCSETPQVSVVGGALRVALPAFQAARSKTYVIKDGRVRG